MKKFAAITLVLFFFLASCAPAASASTESTLNQPVAITPTPTLLVAPDPTTTEEPIPSASFTEIVSPTAESTATPQPLQIMLVDTSSRHNLSSKFVLSFSTPGGSYYALASYQGSKSITYQCEFDKSQPKYLVCNGGGVPANTSVYINLFKTDTNEKVYSNVMSFSGIIPTPTGMSCEVEPQWNGRIPAHQLQQNCFALSCWQNGTFFFGSDNTCVDPWPYDWDFYHPLSTPN